MSEITELILCERVRHVGGKRAVVFRLINVVVRSTYLVDITERDASSSRSLTRHTLGDLAPSLS